MRESTAREEAVLKALREHLVDATLSAKTVASPEASRAYVEKVLQGEKADHRALARLGAMYEAAVAQDRSAAVEMVEAVLRAAGIRGSFVPEAAAESTSSLLVEGAEAGAAVGEVQAAVLRAAPVDEVRRAAVRASRELADVVVLARRLEERAQPAFAGVLR
jgi:hypothetical protein